MVRLPPRTPLDLPGARSRLERLETGNTLFEEAALRRLSNRSVVVSIGEGTGEYLLALGRRFPRLRFIGFDLDPKSLEIARQLRSAVDVTNVDFVRAEALALPLRDGAAHYVYSRCVFQVIPDKEEFLREIKRIARGGVHISMVRNNLIAGLYVRLSSPVRVLLRGGTLRDAIEPARQTEAWLKKIDAYRGIRWYEALIRKYFPTARITCSRLRPSVGFEVQSY